MAPVPALLLVRHLAQGQVAPRRVLAVARAVVAAVVQAVVRVVVLAVAVAVVAVVVAAVVRVHALPAAVAGVLLVVPASARVIVRTIVLLDAMDGAARPVVELVMVAVLVLVYGIVLERASLPAQAHAMGHVLQRVTRLVSYSAIPPVRTLEKHNVSL